MKLAKLFVLILVAFTASVRAAHQSADEAAIRALEARQPEAWNRHDAKAFASLFTENGDCVNIVGWWWKCPASDGMTRKGERDKLRAKSERTVAMEKKNRRQFSPADKVRILRLHLLEGKAISEICEAEGIHPTLFYQWQKTFFEKGTAAFEKGRSPSRVSNQNQGKIAALESKLQRKDEVIAEIMEDLVRTKKDLGEN